MNYVREKIEKHIYVIDFLRGVAALGVVLVHFGGLGFIDNVSVSRFLNFGKYGVEVFFVISGFIIPWSLFNNNYHIKKFGSFIWKRSIRIDPPYYLVVIVSFVFYYSKQTGSLFIFKIDFYQFLCHLFYLIPFTKYDWYTYLFWTLAVEFQYYLIIGLCFGLIISKKPLLRYMFFLFFITLYWLPYFHNNTQLIFRYAPIFLLGIILFLYKIRNISIFEFVTLTFILSGLIYIQLGIPQLIASQFAFLFILFVEFKSTITGFLSRISYSLYITHSFVGIIFIHITKYFLISSGMKYFFVLFMIGVALMIAYYYYRFIERPFLSLSRKIKM